MNTYGSMGIASYTLPGFLKERGSVVHQPNNADRRRKIRFLGNGMEVQCNQTMSRTPCMPWFRKSAEGGIAILVLNYTGKSKRLLKTSNQKTWR